MGTFFFTLVRSSDTMVMSLAQKLRQLFRLLSMDGYNQFREIERKENGGLMLYITPFARLPPTMKRLVVKDSS